MPHEQFDRSRLILKPLAQRTHDLDRSCLIFPESPREPFTHEAIGPLAQSIVASAGAGKPMVDVRSRSRKTSGESPEGPNSCESGYQDPSRRNRAGRTVMFCCGAHVLRTGNGPLLIDLMRRGLVSHVAFNGAGAIHDFEMALIGQTTESVARYVRTGEFGLWNETGRINDAVTAGSRDGLGFGEAVGRMIEDEAFPYRETSLLAAGVRLGVPVTVHVSIGQDIVHEHPNFDPAATGSATYADFLVFAQSITRLEGGVFLNIGTAVMGPEVYLKALTMARNVARQEGRSIGRFTTGVFDLLPLGEHADEEVRKSDPRYYFRPYKTVLVRTVADGGTSYYIQGDHRRTIPALYDAIIERVKEVS